MAESSNMVQIAGSVRLGTKYKKHELLQAEVGERDPRAMNGTMPGSTRDSSAVELLSRKVDD